MTVKETRATRAVRRAIEARNAADEKIAEAIRAREEAGASGPGEQEARVAKARAAMFDAMAAACEMRAEAARLKFEAGKSEALEVEAAERDARKAGIADVLGTRFRTIVRVSGSRRALVEVDEDGGLEVFPAGWPRGCRGWVLLEDERGDPVETVEHLEAALDRLEGSRPTGLEDRIAGIEKRLADVEHALLRLAETGEET